MAKKRIPTRDETPEQARERVIKARKEAYRRFANSDDGATILEDMKEQIGDRVSFDPSNQFVTAYNEGQRSVYLQFLSFLEEATDPRPRQTKAIMDEEEELPLRGSDR